MTNPVEQQDLKKLKIEAILRAADSRGCGQLCEVCTFKLSEHIYYDGDLFKGTEVAQAYCL